MASDSEGEGKGWMATLAEGGLPQVLAGPAGKAISRLIGASADIPAAWLEQKAQAIRDETNAKSAMMQALSQKSTELGMADEKLLERGLNSMIGKAYREQANREAVAAKTVEHLNDEPARPDIEGPSDDWLNVFEEHAAKASSEQLRETWARVLAGEIRKPRTISLATLNFVALLDKPVAEATEYALGLSANRKMVLVNEPEGEEFKILNSARAAGVIYQLDTDIRQRGTLDAHVPVAIDLCGTVLLITGEPGSQVEWNGCSLTRTGVELFGILEPKRNDKAREILIEQLKKQPAVKAISQSYITQRISDESFSYQVPVLPIWSRETPA